jgi:gliding motility-associated-like protein
MKKLLLFIPVLLNVVTLSATHMRAGEITYIQLSDLTYKITVTTYTYTLSPVDRKEYTIDWGDNSTSVAPRISKTVLPSYFYRNIYEITHTYPGPGVYNIYLEDPNRNEGVENIPNSVNVVFSISTTLIVNASMGHNNTPVLLNPPYDKAALGQVFIHNPGAYDPDGDSLSYNLTVCTREDGKKIEGYTLPAASNYLKVDSITGDLIWNAPVKTGSYNVAIEINEWRNGIKIGKIVRDMQIEVFETNNKPPVNGTLNDLCVEAEDTVSFPVIATDQDNDRISLSSTSGIYSISSCPASFTKADSTPGYSSSVFRWIPCHEAVRNQPYDVIFKSDDNNADVNLTSISNVKIKVLGPSPYLITAVPQGKFISLTWSDYGTGVISGFSIYRKEEPSSFIPDSCTAGILSTTGYIKAGYISGSASVTFTDSDNGEGFESGKVYSYRIVAVYPNGTESKPSNEILSTLVSGISIIKKVSVRNTDPLNGSIYLEWKRPGRTDTIPGAVGPFEYLIYRADGISRSNFHPILSIPSTYLNDTVAVDTLVNTTLQGYLYKVELWNKTPGNEFAMGDASYASSLFLEANPGNRKAILKINRNVPWINNRYDFYRFNDLTLKFDSIGSGNQLTFTDYDLTNGTEYSYLVHSTGAYLADNMPDNLINFSQIASTIPVDNELPCTPSINVNTDCDSLFNNIRWHLDDLDCSEDIAGYNVYYKGFYDEDLLLIATISDKNILSYRHFPGEIVAGCYAVSAFDENLNEGDLSSMICIDSCNFYEIPNVFTPNGDNINDKLIAKTSGLVEKVDFKLFSRAGVLIFETNDPELNWEGTYKGKIVSPGVYFYRCDVYERRISGLEVFDLTGFIHVITEKDAKISPSGEK